MDRSLQEHIDKIHKAIEDLSVAEEVFLTLDAHKKTMLAILLLSQEGKSHAEKEAKAYAHDDWVHFSKGLVRAEVDYNKTKRLYECALKAYDGMHLTYKIENQGIQRA